LKHVATFKNNEVFSCANNIIYLILSCIIFLRGRPKKNWVEGIKKAMNERNLSEGLWEDRKQWSLGVGQRRKTFWTRYIHTYHISLL